MTHLTLRPMSIGDLLDEAIRLYRRNFIPFVGVVAVVQVPVLLLNLLMAMLNLALNPQQALGLDMLQGMLRGQPMSTEEMIARSNQPSPGLEVLIGFMVLSYLINYLQLVGYLAVLAGTARMVLSHFLDETAGIGATWRATLSRWKSLFGLSALIIILDIGLVIWCIVPCVGWLSGPPLLAYLNVCWMALAAPVVALEGTGAAGALRRSWHLARTRFWHLVGVGLFGYVLQWILVSAPALVILVAMTVVGLPAMAGLIGSNVVTLTLMALISPVILIAISLLYLDMRVRHEGLDLALQAEALVPPALPAVAAPRVLPGPAAKEPLFNVKDRTNLLILGGLILVPIMLCIGLPMLLGFIGSMGSR